MTGITPIIELRDISKSYGNNTALSGINISVYPGEVHCLLGDNGAGKSTLIKMMSGVVPPSTGQILFDGKPVNLASPREAMAYGIATVHQDVGSIPLLGVARNFFLGVEPTKGWGPFKRIDFDKAGEIAIEHIRAMGISRVTDPDQLVGTMSGGERQALAIARALYLGAKVLILDEPTAALGVRESSVVIDAIRKARAQGVALVFITHNAPHAFAVGDRYTVLLQGRVAASFSRGEKTLDELTTWMAGGKKIAEDATV
ncbi:ATP-binding cassette domain-containing protein [Rhizobium sp. C4]|uniref:ATP-binding cassette domain-containing protein n=1 Tax=Rhizobium sp. C4 TaxID=1349800 RepID=UPI001E632211|nr:ATP-binding cassette domain-containing protein [Rhizobium sp. C4]MCD2172315.1 ATP-binding cassette domain-containing protein [Rhizobium sp. C4]